MIRQRYLCVLTLAATIGCDVDLDIARRHVDRKPWCTSDAMRAHVLECVRGAGRSGDSEPEDWLRICERQARRLNCPIEFVVRFMGAEKLCSEALPEAQRWCSLVGWSE